MYLAFQVVRWTLGGLLYAIAILLYENQERVVQNRLEELWIWAVDRKDAELSRTARFVQGVARLTNRAFDSVLGKRLWSLQAVAVCVWFSLASMFLTVLVMAHIRRFAQPGPTLSLVMSFLAFVGLGVLPILVDHIRWAFAVWAAVVLIFLRRLSGFVFFVIQKYGYAPVLHTLATLLVIVLLSFGCDVLYISVTRWMLRRMLQIQLLYELIGFIVLDVALAVVLVYGPIKFAGVMMNFTLLIEASLAGVFVVMCNFGNFIACSVFFIVLVALLLHRLMWPILERHIYALQRYDLIRKKWLLFSLATALWFGPKGFEFVKFVMALAH